MATVYVTRLISSSRATVSCRTCARSFSRRRNRRVSLETTSAKEKSSSHCAPAGKNTGGDTCCAQNFKQGVEQTWRHGGGNANCIGPLKTQTTGKSSFTQRESLFNQLLRQPLGSDWVNPAKLCSSVYLKTSGLEKKHVNNWGGVSL